MAKYSISERKALRKMHITDFRHMTKDKILPFFEMAPHMDPEVVKAAINQFPQFKELGSEMLSSLNIMVNKAFESETTSQNYFYEACNGMLATLKTQLDDDNIDSNERALIMDNMMQILAMIAQKDSEHKAFIVKTVMGICGAIASVAVIAANALGSHIELPTKSTYNDSLNENDCLPK